MDMTDKYSLKVPIVKRYKVLTRMACDNFMHDFLESLAGHLPGESPEFNRGRTAAINDFKKMSEMYKKGLLMGETAQPHMTYVSKVYKVKKVVTGLELGLDTAKYKSNLLVHMADNIMSRTDCEVKRVDEYDLDFFIINSDSVFLVLEEKEQQSQIFIS